MKGFNFEKNLPHQEQAVKSTLSVFEGLQLHDFAVADRQFVNPIYYANGQALPFGKYRDNIKAQQLKNSIEAEMKQNSNLIDIMMETGTGKTYTYTKTMFELNRQHGIFKFIVVVPTLSIKAGTINFLKSESSREHFKEQYGKTLHLHLVESQKGGKNKKSVIPSAVVSFVQAGNFDRNNIQVLVINAGMINSETMQKDFDRGLFDKYAVPFEAIAATKPFMIIDEPHKFAQSNKTWDNIQKMKPQFILRYGATFPEKTIERNNGLGKKEKIAVKDYHNLIYQLTAVDAFNGNLVKGIIGYIANFENVKNALVKLTDTDGTEASFERIENGQRKTIKVSKKENLQKVHQEMTDLRVESLNKSAVVLSNGLEMKKGDKINPYSYAKTLQDLMIEQAIKRHFELERTLLLRPVKIKPLTLFFIDNIEAYRDKDGYLRKKVEERIKAEVEMLLQTETDDFYKSYLQKTLQDLAATHGGYFSKDNTEKDEAIEQEINEILHDKQTMLDLDNPRRFIFSKWTLREGWDNPNVFQICKLRSSGSEVSKLQEVGRGLRLPVNEYGNRVKGEQFFLNYFVDFTESDFVDKLVREINEKSGAISVEIIPTKLSNDMIKQIMKKYNFSDENSLLGKLIIEDKVINFSKDFQEGGFEFIKANYPLIFEGVNSNKVRKATDLKKKIAVRTGKYGELQALWEKLNERVILTYQFKTEAHFQQFFTNFLKTQKGKFTANGINEQTVKIEIENRQAVAREAESIYDRKVASGATMKYSDFLKTLSQMLHINLKTVHQSILEADTDLNPYLNAATIRVIKQHFEEYLMANAFDKFSIEYKKVSNNIHPTKLTDGRGTVLKSVFASDIGILSSEEKVASSYFFEELYYDSQLEKSNIKQEIAEVTVFTKIPKNSIKIPVAGGKSYSPDFAYVLKLKDGAQKLHFIVETKNVKGAEELRQGEYLKIEYAKQFFGENVKIEFRTQFNNDKISHLIQEIITEK